MNSKIFVNLPVKDLKRSMDFFGELGFSFNPQFTNDKAACMVISDDGYVMLLTEPFFKTFTKKHIVNAKKEVETLVSLSENSREQVDGLVEKALANGASTAGETQDMGYMYGRSFNDPDGHTWELVWMDLNAMQEGGAQA
jgi:uncharacterized protein